MAKSIRVVIGTNIFVLSTLFMSSAAFAQEFSGPYAGIEAGLGSVKAEGSTIAGPFSRSDDSALAGAVLGYRTQLGADGLIVAGVEGGVAGYTSGAGARFTLSGIGGVRLGSSGLLYGRAGYGWLKKADVNGKAGLDGVIFGGGYEHRLSDGMHLRAEYKHLGYRDRDFPDNTAHFSGHEITTSLIFGF